MPREFGARIGANFRAPLLSRSPLQAALIATVIALLLIASSARLPEGFVDFRAFYCAGQAELSGADPYRIHPLHECEQRYPAPGLSPMHYGVTVPAPFPGFVLALFALLATLPFGFALAIWQGASCLALGAAIVLVARTTNTSLTANAIVIGFPAVVVALQLGQVTPFIVLAVAGSAALLQADRPRAAALVALTALLDPHAGLALVLGVFVAVRPARAVLAAGAIALFALGVAVSGPSREWEYVRTVLPAHALANLTDAAQFSTTNLAFEAGASPPLALTLGSLWYVGALAAGVIIALRLRARFGVAAVAYIPAAFAVFGGAHTHFQQLALATPAFMLLCSAASGSKRDFRTAVTFVAAMPWLFVGPFPWLFVVPPLLAVVFAREMQGGRQVFRLAAASFVTLGIILIAILRSHTVRTLLHQDIAGNPLAEVSWQAFTVARNVPTETWYVVAKAPTVIAFIILFALLVRTARNGPAVVREC